MLFRRHSELEVELDNDGKWQFLGSIAGRSSLESQMTLDCEECDENPPTNRCKSFLYFRWRVIKRKWAVVSKHRKTLIISLLAFCLLCTIGVITVLEFSKRYSHELQMTATSKAKQMGFLFTEELDKALLPLFTMEEMVEQLTDFDNLTSQAENLPVYKRGTRPFRNATGVCDDPVYTAQFNGIAASVKKSAGMEKILVNIQLAPYGVVCLLYPLINEEDFENGLKMDNRGAVGLDLLNDPVSGYYTQQAIKEKRVTVQGPLRLVQGNTSVVKEAFIARNPILKAMNHIEIDDAEYEFWGFSSVLLNWEELKKKLKIYEFFSGDEMEFILTRNDTLINATTKEKYNRVVTIAESKGSELLNSKNNVSVPLQTTDNEWLLTVGYVSGFYPTWVGVGCIGVVLGSFVLSYALLVFLIAKKEHELLLYKMIPRDVIHSLRKGDTVVEKYDLATIGIIDIVSFTTMSGRMKPSEIMFMIRGLFTKFHKLVDKYGIYNVDTIGDAYIVIGGGPDKRSGREGAKNVTLFVLEAIEFVRRYQCRNGSRIQIRAGLASGPVVAGVVGKIPKYTLFGNTLNLASYLETRSKPMKIQCSDLTSHLLREVTSHTFQLREHLFDRDEKKDSRVYGINVTRSWFVRGVGNAPEPPENRQFFRTSTLLISESGKESGKDSDSEKSLQEDLTASNTTAACDMSVSEDSHEDVLEMVAAPKKCRVYRFDNDTGGFVLCKEDSSVIDEDVLGQKISTDDENPLSLEEQEHNLEGTSLEGRCEDNVVVLPRRLSEDGASENSFAMLEVGSIYSKSSSAFHDYWSRMAIMKDLWKRDVIISSEPRRTWLALCQIPLRSLRRTINAALSSRKILVIAFLTFATICTVGILTLFILSEEYEKSLRIYAINKCHDTDRLLSNELRKALIPLHALAELVKQLHTFDSLPSAIEHTTMYTSEGTVYRDVNGICDDPEFTTPFHEIASSMNESHKMSKLGLNKTVVSLLLAPSAVVCLCYETMHEGRKHEHDVFNYDHGMFGKECHPDVYGKDLLNDPVQSHYAREAIEEGRVAIHGPQKTEMWHDVPMEVLYAKKPIFIDGYKMEVDGNEYPLWGLAAVHLKWKNLKEVIALCDLFEDAGMEFSLERNDISSFSLGEMSPHQTGVLAQSKGAIHLNEKNSVTQKLFATDSEWTLTVGYAAGFSPRWKIWGSVCVVFGALLITYMFILVLLKKKEHELLLYRMMPRPIISKLRRGENIFEKYDTATLFFSHIVGFSTLSGQMMPAELMSMLNEIFAEFDKLVKKHQVHKVETIGDAYIVIGGGPDKSDGVEGAQKVALFALDVLKFAKNFQYKGMKVFIRTGLASGAVVAGVIDPTLPKYNIFGDTVNFASRMESTSKSMKIQCNEATYELLSKSKQYKITTEKRAGEGDETGIHVKGKGIVNTWWINGAIAADFFENTPTKRFSLIFRDGSREIPQKDIYMASNVHNTVRRSRRHSTSSVAKRCKCQNGIGSKVTRRLSMGSIDSLPSVKSCECQDGINEKINFKPRRLSLVHWKDEAKKSNGRNANTALASISNVPTKSNTSLDNIFKGMESKPRRSSVVHWKDEAEESKSDISDDLVVHKVVPCDSISLPAQIGNFIQKYDEDIEAENCMNHEVNSSQFISATSSNIQSRCSYDDHLKKSTQLWTGAKRYCDKNT